MGKYEKSTNWRGATRSGPRDSTRGGAAPLRPDREPDWVKVYNPTWLGTMESINAYCKKEGITYGEYQTREKEGKL